MNPKRVLRTAAWAALAVAGVAASADATTLRRAGLDELTATNKTIVVGEVVDSHSYWNAEGTFILTDARVAARDVLKGAVDEPYLTVTVLGGSVGETTALVVGGAQLARGASYLIFLSDGDLPGARGVRTVVHHSQGVFRVVEGPDGPRAVSEANGQRLVPDASGSAEVVGGATGYPLEALKDLIRKSAGRDAGAVR